MRGNIRVHCRLRPLISRLDSPGDEESLGMAGTPSERVVDLQDEDKLIVRPAKPVGGQMQKKEFEFERVYGPDTDQKSLFDDVKPLLTSLLDGWVHNLVWHDKSALIVYPNTLLVALAFCESPLPLHNREHVLAVK